MAELENLTNQERLHFNRLSDAREQSGFIPDLRRMGKNDYFYLSPFRRGELAKLSLGRMVEFTARCVRDTLPPGAKVLDICCGNGWYTLELARLGMHVTAIDLSEGNIAVAKKTLETADLSPGQGTIQYLVADATCWRPLANDFDLVVFTGGLHHLPETEKAVANYREFLKPGGYFLCSEPHDENYGEVEAAIATLVRVCLSSSGSWYERLPLPENAEELRTQVAEVRREYVTWSDKTEGGNQSPANNSSGATDIWALSNRYFQLVQSEPYLPLMHRLIGGVRLRNDEENLAFAKFWFAMEQFLYEKKVLRPGGFLFYGIKK